jgi:uncharacterized protein YbjT (DUF2867 family)
LEVTYNDRESCLRGLDGVETVFMVSAAEHPDRLHHHRVFVDAAAQAGVANIVYTSFMAAGPDATFTLARDHFATEKHIIDSGLSYTFLRDNFYADFMSTLADPHGVIRGPAADGRVSVVARLDVAKTAAAILNEPVLHRNTTYDLTGPESLTLSDIAEAITAVGGRPIRFHNETLEEAYRSRQSFGAPRWQLDAWVSTYSAIASGELQRVSGAIKQITGEDPQTLREVLMDNPPAP